MVQFTMSDQTRPGLELLIHTKLLCPRIRTDLVQRPHLIRRLDAGAQRALTLISAPAGFGKTTLLAAWASAQAMPVAWFSLDYQDNDLRRFLTYLTQAIGGVIRATGMQPIDLTSAIQALSLEAGLTQIINELAALTTDVALVLDEYHVIDNPEIHRAIDFLIDHQPAWLHLFIASRTDPPLVLHRLRASNQIIELRSTDLAFTHDEVAVFLQQTMGLSLAAESVANLDAYAEGWVTGLQFAALALLDDSRNSTHASGDFVAVSAQDRHLFDYMAVEVLHQQPPEAQHFLLRTSILESLAGPLCDAVADPSAPEGHGQAVLAELYRRNLFLIALDEGRQVFRYHSLFSSFLQEVLKETHPEEVSELHRRASDWYCQHGHIEQAINHSLAAGELERASALVEQHYQSMMPSYSIVPLLGWIRNLPEEWVRNRPRLCLACAWGLTLNYDLDSAEEWVERAERSVPPAAWQADLHELDKQTRLLLGEIEVCQVYIATLRGQGLKSIELSRRAMMHLPPDNLFLRSLLALDQSIRHMFQGDVNLAEKTAKEVVRISQQAGSVMTQMLARAQMGEALFVQGRLTRAMVTYRHAIQLAQMPEGTPISVAGVLYIGLGDILRERNELDASAHDLKRGIALGRVWMPISVLDGLLSMARLAQSRGDTHAAQAYVTEAQRLADSTEASQWDDMLVSVTAARLALQQGRLQEALNWASQESLLNGLSMDRPSQLPFALYELQQFMLARLWLALGRQEHRPGTAQQALDILAHMEPELLRLGRLGPLTELRLLKALAYQELGQIEPALASLRAALAHTEVEGYVRCLLDEGTPLARLVSSQLSAQRRAPSSVQFPSTGYLRQLLDLFARDAMERSGGASSAVIEVGETPMEAATSCVQHAQADYIEALSPRELEVLRLVATGASNQAIAQTLCLSTNTVKRHVNSILSKLGMTSRTQAVVRAHELGLLD